MAERNTAEELDDVYEIKYSTDVMTGGADKRMYLYYQLADSIKKADSVDIIVSFLMESGVKMLLGELDDALKRGAKIRILTIPDTISLPRMIPAQVLHTKDLLYMILLC